MKSIDARIFIGLALQTPASRWKVRKNTMFGALDIGKYLYYTNYGHTQLGICQTYSRALQRSAPLLFVSAYDGQRMYLSEDIQDFYSKLTQNDFELQQIAQYLLPEGR